MLYALSCCLSYFYFKSINNHLSILTLGIENCYFNHLIIILKILILKKKTLQWETINVHVKKLNK